MLLCSLHNTHSCLPLNPPTDRHLCAGLELRLAPLYPAAPSICPPPSKSSSSPSADATAGAGVSSSSSKMITDPGSRLIASSDIVNALPLHPKVAKLTTKLAALVRRLLSLPKTDKAVVATSWPRLLEGAKSALDASEISCESECEIALDACEICCECEVVVGRGGGSGDGSGGIYWGCMFCSY